MKRTGHYVVSTHWDREWYESFQGFRFRLVRMLDEVLDTMRRNPEFRYFQMDGQVIPIEDYLEVRPEREEEIRALVKEGRLRIGPWYVLPDEFLVSGESLVRNLQMGLTISQRYGAINGGARVGFVCDLFGHTSQLPQILRGFGIDNAIIWRGVNEDTHGGMFRWRSPDGSEVIVYRFSPIGGYCTWAFRVRKGLVHEEPVETETAVKAIRELVTHESERCPTPALLLFDGGDHMEIEPRTPDLLKKAAEGLKDAEILFSHLEGYMEDVREQRDLVTKVVEGELREPGKMGDEAWLIPGVASSRVHLKQANVRCENELCLWAEPLSVFAATLGKEYPARYLELAWRHLLQNQPHDSICGCSIDQVHKDMEYRYDQSYGIANLVARDAMKAIADRVKLPELGEKDVALVVFNPTSQPVDGPVDLTLRFPRDIDAFFQEFFGFEQKIAMRVYDAAGNELPYQYLALRRDQQMFRRPLRKFPSVEFRHELDISVSLRIPAYGYTTIVCRPVKNEPTRHLGSMAVDDHTIENESLRVSVNPNGTLTLTDKRSGQVYDRLLTLEDCADIGDGWFHGTAVSDRVYSSIACPADVSLSCDGIAKATLTVRVTMNVPAEFDFARMVRSDRLAPLVVTHHVTLRRGANSVEVHTVVENTIRDHRLRLLLPTGAQTDTYLADQVYDVVERPIALRKDFDAAYYKELEVETRPQQSWTAVHDAKRGLAVVSVGLRESAVRDQPERPIALTLLRSFIKAVMTPGNEGGQIQGKHTFDYRIVPLQGQPDVTELFHESESLAAGVRWYAIESLTATGDEVGRTFQRDLPPEKSFLSIDAARAVVTAIHRRTADEIATIRVFNPTSKGDEVRVSLADAKVAARLTDLEGRPGDPLPIEGGKVKAPLAPRQILTVRLDEAG